MTQSTGPQTSPPFCVPTMPPAIPLPSDLESLVYNLAWSFHPVLKRGLLALTETATTRDALAALPTTSRAKLEGQQAHADVQAALAVMDEVRAPAAPTLAYFCAEFGVDPALPIYSGGLGILAGDHIKSTSDMDVPLIGVGLLYRRAYFHQTVGPEGAQEHHQERIDLLRTPVRQVRDPKSEHELVVEVPMGDTTVRASVWLAQVGRTAVLLLDTDRPDNDAAYRGITHSLYVGSREARLCQEIVLGIGGVRALAALDIEPQLYHLNEGHSALMLVERLARAKKSGATFDAARKAITARTGFTIHTPVPAGNERFEHVLFDGLLGPYLDAAGLERDDIHRLGQASADDLDVFDMTAFGLRHSSTSNGVSLLHGRVAHETWKNVSDVPLFGLTNGVHLPTWIGPEVQDLLVDAGLAERTSSARFALPAVRIDEADAKLKACGAKAIAAARTQQKARLFQVARDRQDEMLSRHGFGPKEHEARRFRFDPHALTVGFARRFAPYKRATLIFSDMERLIRLVSDEARPVQFVFAGKAHPKDTAGQALIKDVLDHAADPRLKGRVAFLEGYNMPLGQALTQGVDVWLNNPRRPREASGTSGMKAAMNGAPNLSILDGWWDEGFDGTNGWAIGTKADTPDETTGDHIDSTSLYDVLENDVIPAFYEGGGARFAEISRRAMATSLWAFSSDRMVGDYDAKMYRPR